jgi:phosphoribosylpyrophosphate synthetase
MVDTGATLYQTAAQLRAQGACTVRACCAYPVLSSNAYRR